MEDQHSSKAVLGIGDRGARKCICAGEVRDLE